MINPPYTCPICHHKLSCGDEGRFYCEICDMDIKKVLNDYLSEYVRAHENINKITLLDSHRCVEAWVPITIEFKNGKTYEGTLTWSNCD
jgi:hypothetical protein